MPTDFSESEFRRTAWLRAVEWISWPSFLSPLFVPILLIWFVWWKVLVSLFCANLVWTLIRYRVNNFGLSNLAAVAVQVCKWPVALTCFGVLIYHGRIGVSILSLLWPLLSGLFVIPGKVGLIESSWLQQINILFPNPEPKLKIWAPIIKGDNEPTGSLAVPCGSKAPNREEYRERLQDRMEFLIGQDPQKAWRDFERMCHPETSPDFCGIKSMFQVKDLAVQLAMSDQMNLLLGKIDWEKNNPPLEETEEALPNLMDYLQELSL